MFLFSLEAMAQVPLRSVVEHFTNTSCSVCAANNGGIHQSISNNPNVLHISFHPSSPYPTDVFNQQNKAENDDRTKFYNIYGATPRTVLNGSVTSYTSLNTALGAVSSLMSNYSITVTQSDSDGQTFLVKTIIKKVSADTNLAANLFLGIIEDTIQQTTNNGETKHFNVFRKAMSSITGDRVILPAMVGDSIVLNNRYFVDFSWNKKKLFVMALLQTNAKTLINSHVSNVANAGTTGLLNVSAIQLNNVLYPNPITNTFYSNLALTNLSIYNLLGEKVASIEKVEPNSPLLLPAIEQGIYTFIAETEQGILVQKVIKQ
jgi:hypothetical protein